MPEEMVRELMKPVRDVIEREEFACFERRLVRREGSPDRQQLLQPVDIKFRGAAALSNKCFWY